MLRHKDKGIMVCCCNPGGNDLFGLEPSVNGSPDDDGSFKVAQPHYESVAMVKVVPSCATPAIVSFFE